jgi:hypothetical protein
MAGRASDKLDAWCCNAPACALLGGAASTEISIKINILFALARPAPPPERSRSAARRASQRPQPCRGARQDGAAISPNPIPAGASAAEQNLRSYASAGQNVGRLAAEPAICWPLPRCAASCRSRGSVTPAFKSAASSSDSCHATNSCRATPPGAPGSARVLSSCERSVKRPQQDLNRFPLPQAHGSFLPITHQGGRSSSER